ncbi:MAG: rhodanese-like domain-containing protein [Cytophagales bacterium]|nr:rhodanese-like domain-containing protein [Cytophagales bacterium]
MDIQAQELKERLEKGEAINLIDVREEWEYEERNINAKNIPLGTLPNRLDEIGAGKDDEIIVHCKSGGRSGQAQKFLISKGYTNVRNLLGGIDGYPA